jgi:hypothetical protein
VNGTQADLVCCVTAAQTPRSFATAACLPVRRDNSARACRGDTLLCAMYESQEAGFDFDQDGFSLVARFFWTWRMPFGGTHEAGWSLKHFLTGLH